MLTTSRIREHFESLEVERLRAEVRELQNRVIRLQSELLQFRPAPNSNAAATNNPSEK